MPEKFDVKKVCGGYRSNIIRNRFEKDAESIDAFTVPLYKAVAGDMEILKTWMEWFRYKKVPFALVDYGRTQIMWKERIIKDERRGSTKKWPTSRV